MQFPHGHPMPTRDHTTLLASHELLVRLADECLAVRVMPTSQTSFFEDWEVTRAALMARMARRLRHLGYLAPSYSRLDGLALARTLMDHVITFAWIRADPKERLPAFMGSSFKDMLAKDKRRRERGDARLLGEWSGSASAATPGRSTRKCRACHGARPRPITTGASQGHRRCAQPAGDASFRPGSSPPARVPLRGGDHRSIGRACGAPLRGGAACAAWRPPHCCFRLEALAGGR